MEKVFTAAAEATMNVMIESLDSIKRREVREFNLENTALDMLLFDFLQEVIFYKDSERLLLRVGKIRIQEKDGFYSLEALTQGESLDPDRHEQRVDVKAVTLHQFSLERTDQGWTTRIILDI